MKFEITDCYESYLDGVDGVNIPTTIELEDIFDVTMYVETIKRRMSKRMREDSNFHDVHRSWITVKVDGIKMGSWIMERDHKSKLLESVIITQS